MPTLQATQVSQLLSSTDLFSRLSAEHLKVVAKACKVVKYDAQAKIVSQGEQGDELFIVASGSVSVIHEEPAIGSEQLVTTLGEGQCFGETSLLSESPRSATIKAAEESTCVVLAKRSFESVLRQIPEVAVEVSRFLAARLHHQCQLTGFRFVSKDDLLYDPDLFALFPETLLRRIRALPLSLHQNSIRVALTNPNHPSAVRELKEAVPGLAIEVVVCSGEDYESFRRRHLPSRQDAPSLGLGSASGELCLSDGTLLQAPLSSLLREALERETSKLILQGSEVLSPLDQGLESFCTLASSVEVEKLHQQLDTNFFDSEKSTQVTSSVLHLDPGLCHLKLSKVPTLHGSRYSIQILDSGQALPDSDEIMPASALTNRFLDQLVQPGQSFLLTGSARSSLKATAYALILEAQKVRGLQNFVSIEKNPVFDLPSVSQIKLEEDWETTLQAAILQFPRGLFLSDLPPTELPTALSSLDETVSSLVTMPCRNPLQQLAELYQEKSEEERLQSLQYLLVQRQLPKLCPHCREEYQLKSSVRSQLERLGASLHDGPYYRSSGCPRCQQRGTSGSLPVFAAIELKPLLKEMLKGGRPADSIWKAARDSKLHLPYSSSVQAWLKRGVASPATALKFLSQQES